MGFVRVSRIPWGSPVVSKLCQLSKTSSCFSSNSNFYWLCQCLECLIHPNGPVHFAQEHSNNSPMERSVHRLPYQVSKNKMVTLCQGREAIVPGLSLQGGPFVGEPFKEEAAGNGQIKHNHSTIQNARQIQI